MKTAEELKEFCYKWLVKAYTTGQRVSPMDANNSEFYLPMLDLDWSKQMKEEIESYAKEHAIEFTLLIIKGTGDKYFENHINGVYKEWINQQTKP